MKPWDGRRRGTTEPQAGIVSVTVTGGVVHTESITFDPPFESTPAITAAAHVPSPTTVAISIANPSATGVDLQVERTTSSTFNVSWHAIPVTQ